MTYELMYILRPDLLEEQVEEVINRYRDFLTERGATDIQIQNRGKRRLAYLIGKHQEGIYILVNYNGDGSEVAPLERSMRLSDEVIRYLTLKLKKQPSVAAAEEESASEPVEAEASS